MKKKTKEVKIEPGETEIEYIEIEKIKEDNMVKNKYIIIGALVLTIPFILAWTFNHINPWLTFGLVLLILLGINQFIKNFKQK